MTSKPLLSFEDDFDDDDFSSKHSINSMKFLNTDSLSKLPHDKKNHAVFNTQKLSAMARLETQDTALYTDQLYDEITSHQILEEKYVKRRGLFKWLLVVWIAFAISVTSFISFICYERLLEWRRHLLEHTLEHREEGEEHPSGYTVLKGFWVYVGFCWVCSALSVASIQFISPPAVGSGVPEVIGYLNGIRVQNVWNIKSFIAKVLSMIFVVPSGLIASIEGPTIHWSAMIGASAAKMKFIPVLSGLRNDREKRDFVTTGTAVGVAAAFRSPIGGLLLALEEAATYWDASLCWRTFLGCLIATFLIIMGKLLLAGKGTEFQPLANLTYTVAGANSWYWWEIPIFVAIGAFEGALGGLFVLINEKMNLARARFYGKIPQGTNKLTRFIKRFPIPFKILEALIACFITVGLGFSIALLIPCQDIPKFEDEEDINERLIRFTCPEGQYNDMASLLVNAYDSSIAILYHSGTSFRFVTLILASIIIFFCANVAAGLGLAGGMVQPMFLVGGIWGRLIGDFIATYIDPSISPGLYALIGSAGFIGGLLRATISFTVILIEVSGKLQFLLPIMTTMMVGKFIGDKISHESLYHMNMSVLKHYPYIERSATRITRLLVAKQVMSPNPKVVRETMNVKETIDLLMSVPHNGFPVISEDDTLIGIILRRHLLLLLRHRLHAPLPQDFRVSELPYAYWFRENARRVRNTKSICEGVPQEDYEMTLDLRPFVNRTPTTVLPDSRVYYIHDLIRALGLRHIIVTDSKQRVQGMITRKDVMSWSLQCVMDGERFDWTTVQNGSSVVG